MLDELDELAKLEFNGRQIRKIMTSAQALASDRGRHAKVTYQDIDQVLKITADFHDYLARNEDTVRIMGIR
jgi:hypothetical protein